MYDPQHTKAFYDAYGTAEWDRLQATAYGRLKAIVHTDFIDSYLKLGDNVLDAGSGPGRFSIVTARLGGRVTVLDISQQQLDLARERTSEAGLLDQVDQFVEADIGDLSMLAEGSFDFVVWLRRRPFVCLRASRSGGCGVSARNQTRWRPAGERDESLWSHGKPGASASPRDS